MSRPHEEDQTPNSHNCKLVHNSNPCLSAKKPLKNYNKSDFNAFENLVWQQSMAEIDDSDHLPRRYPHKRARLVHHDYDLSKRWYVIFYAWDVSKERLVRRRLFDPINSHKTVAKRIAEADNIIREVNRALSENKVLGKDNLDSKRKNVLKLTLNEAIDYVRAQKELVGHRKNYIESFDRLKSNINKWLEHEGRQDFPLRKFSNDDAYSFFDFLTATRKVANKTHNNYRTDLATVFNFLMKRNARLFDENPAMIIDKLPVVAHKHAALSTAQMELVKAECQLGNLRSLLLLIQMIYYSFGRPREVLRLKIENIDMIANRILFPAEISKTKTDEYVGIVPSLRKILLSMNLNQYPREFYLFGANQMPGPKPMDYRFFYTKNRIVFQRLGFDKASVNYSVYSYKHSGVIALYMATKDIKLCQAQCRHKSLEQTNNYLRDLGLLSDYDGLQKWEGSI